MKPEEGTFPARSGHSAVAVGSSIYVFGGLNTVECEVYNDVHAFDTRTLINCDLPLHLSPPILKTADLHGDTSQTPLAVETRKWSKVDVSGDAPKPRNAHAAVLLPLEAAESTHRRMLIYGGSSPEEGAFNDVFLLHVPLVDETGGVNERFRWEKMECCGERPEPRELHCAALISSTSICFSGGRNFDGNICTDMALLDCTTWEWQLIPICEWNRCSHAAGKIDDCLVSFGGFDGGAIRNDCWVYDDNHESWLRVNAVATDAEMIRDDKRESQIECPETSPSSSSVSERFGHAGCTIVLNAASTTARQKKAPKQALLIFGGMNASSDLNDLVLIAQM